MLGWLRSQLVALQPSDWVSAYDTLHSYDDENLLQCALCFEAGMHMMSARLL